MKKLILSLIVLTSLTITNCSKSEDKNTPMQENPNDPYKEAPKAPPMENPYHREPPITASDYVLSEDGKTLIKWLSRNRSTLDMQADPILNKVTTIAKKAFENSYFASINISNEVSTIDQSAFKNSGRLREITIPSSVLFLRVKDPNAAAIWGEDSPFYGCNNLEKITCGAKKIETFTFSNLSNLHTVIFTDGETLRKKFASCLDDEAIKNCQRLWKLTIPSSVRSISSTAFIGSTSKLEELSYGVENVKYDLFNRAQNLKKITLLEGVTSIETQAFENCTSLTTLTLKATTPPTLKDRALNSTALTHIYVPAASVDSYKNDRKWGVFADKIQAIP